MSEDKKEESGGYQSSGSDPRGRQQNEIDYQKDRYENQQGPLINQASYNYGRSSEADYGDYTDIMNQYRGIATGAGSVSRGGGGGGSSGGSGGGGGGGFSWSNISPQTAAYKDPFNSYAGFTEFSETGGYSPEDIANMRARGISPIRAAYANAEREMGRQRSLQGGYSANAFAGLGRMAREQGQAAADATQNVEAGLAEARNRGRLSGLGGMSDIEGQRLGADVDLAKFNSQQAMAAAQANAAGRLRAASAGASARNAANQTAAYSAAQNTEMRLRALGGMTDLRGQTPGTVKMYGDQATSLSGQGGTFGGNMVGYAGDAAARPGAWDTGMGRMRDVGDMGGRMTYPWLD